LRQNPAFERLLEQNRRMAKVGPLAESLPFFALPAVLGIIASARVDDLVGMFRKYDDFGGSQHRTSKSMRIASHTCQVGGPPHI
jgi:hypothetical protein